ncbi:hypothetical protein AALP_AA8G311900 [Arabis alpina]|uniref:Uncharacterized protein n=1 Tax=Arabis alpina TaxID=50452 RepID=A0A087GAN0_ARAAL|nr:hypothetical protein AALP_AA8G311900 [Arabis alpina]
MKSLSPTSPLLEPDPLPPETSQPPKPPDPPDPPDTSPLERPTFDLMNLSRVTSSPTNPDLHGTRSDSPTNDMSDDDPFSSSLAAKVGSAATNLDLDLRIVFYGLGPSFQMQIIGPSTNIISQPSLKSHESHSLTIWPRSDFLNLYAILLTMSPNCIDERTVVGFMPRVVSSSFIFTILKLKLRVPILFQRSKSKLSQPSLEELIVHSTSHFRVIRFELLDVATNSLHRLMLKLSSRTPYSEHPRPNVKYRHSRPSSTEFVHGSRASSELLLPVNKLRPSKTAFCDRSPTLTTRCINVGPHFDYLLLLHAFVLRIRGKLSHRLFHDIEKAPPLHVFIFLCIAVFLLTISPSSLAPAVNRFKF